MNAQSTTTSLLIQRLWKKENGYFLHLLQGKNPEKTAATDYPLFSTWAAFNHGVSEYRQSSKMQRCKPWIISLGGQDHRKAEAELSQSLTLERNGGFIFTHAPFSLYVKPAEGERDFISSQVSYSTSWSHTHIQAILSVNLLYILSQSCYRSSLNSPFELCNS